MRESFKMGIEISGKGERTGALRFSSIDGEGG